MVLLDSGDGALPLLAVSYEQELLYLRYLVKYQRGT